jgi:ankyrin repeat protein
MNELQQPPIEEDEDVFSAIHADNYKRFLACFSKGVDMCKYDPEGYSPLTLACKMGNNEMVKFFIDNIDNNVDLSRKDGRGYNALETAAIYNFRDICELLCKADKTLVSKSGDLVELSKQNSFTDWISKL